MQREGAWQDRIIYSLLATYYIFHNWLVPPVWLHWTIFVPLSFFYPALSMHIPLTKFLIRNPCPYFRKCHLWFHLLFLSHITILYPAFSLDFGTSITLPQLLLTMIQLFCIVILFTSSNLNCWVWELGSNAEVRSLPSKESAMSLR